MKPVIPYKYLFELVKTKKSRNYFWLLRKYKRCFTGDIKKDVANANKVIDSILNNNTAHGVVSFFKWALNNFYGIKFNPKYIKTRQAEISKMTTRLDNDQIAYLRLKYNQWINEDVPGVVENRKKWIKWKRTRDYYVFEALLCSGMRIGELCAIKFKTRPAHRFVKSNINGDVLAEIMINTEKTGKQREIYIPKHIYEWFVNNEIAINHHLVKENFAAFRKWAKLPFRITAHVMRRTKATLMHECGVDVDTISMVLGNQPKTVMNHYIISSGRNFDAVDLANAFGQGDVQKDGNLYFNKQLFKVKGNVQND